MRSILLSAVVLMVVAGLGASGSVHAAALAFDSAADPAYGPYLQSFSLPSGVNGGYGWGSGWEGVSGPIDLSLRVEITANFGLTDPITSPGAMWVLPFVSGIPSGNPGAVRMFDGGLQPGQTFSFDSYLLSDFFLLDPNKNPECQVYLYDPTHVLLTYFGPPYTQLQMTVPYTEEGGHFSITPVDSNNAILSITSYGPGGGTTSIEMPYSTAGGVHFDAQRDMNEYVNNLSITPEPASAALIATAGLGLLLRRSRRSRALNTPGIAL